MRKLKGQCIHIGNKIMYILVQSIEREKTYAYTSMKITIAFFKIANSMLQPVSNSMQIKEKHIQSE